MLENLAKEERIKQTTLAGNGMKSVVNSFKIQSKLNKRGFENIREKAHKKTHQEREKDELCEKAEKHFFATLSREKQLRLEAEKPLIYTESS